jgi:hypothetical protein
MRGARHPALTLVAATVAVALLTTVTSGCGSSGTEAEGEGSTKSASPPGASVRSCAGTSASLWEPRVTGASCATGRQVVAGWTSKKKACATRAGDSRTSCSVDGYRCLATATEHGIAVSCARQGRSISFVVGSK